MVRNHRWIARGVAALALVGSGLTLATAGTPTGATRAATAIAPCRSPDVAATFDLVPGSPGAGSVTYALRVRNRSTAVCEVSGLPGLVLLGAERGEAAD